MWLAERGILTVGVADSGTLDAWEPNCGGDDGFWRRCVIVGVND